MNNLINYFQSEKPYYIRALIISFILSITGIIIIFFRTKLEQFYVLITQDIENNFYIIKLNFIASFTAIIISILLYKLLINLSTEIQKPKIIFTDCITLRKIYNGKNKDNFALSVKIGVKNLVTLFNTKMSLCYVRYSHNNIETNSSIERHGIEEFIAYADYIEIVRRFDFFSDDLSFLTLKPIVQQRGKPNEDKIIIIFSGFYDFKEPKKFIAKKIYSFENIKLAKQTGKVATFKDKNHQLIPTLNWEKFNETTFFDEKQTEQLIKDLYEILKQKDTSNQN